MLDEKIHAFLYTKIIEIDIRSFMKKKVNAYILFFESQKNINDVQVFHLMRPYLQEVAFYIFTITLTCKMALPYI